MTRELIIAWTVTIIVVIGAFASMINAVAAAKARRAAAAVRNEMATDLRLLATRTLHLGDVIVAQATTRGASIDAENPATTEDVELAVGSAIGLHHLLELLRIVVLAAAKRP